MQQETGLCFWSNQRTITDHMERLTLGTVKCGDEHLETGLTAAPGSITNLTTLGTVQK